MKKINSITLLLAIAISFNLSAQNGGVYDDFIYNNTKPIERKVSSVVSHVTVFNSQAQVTRTAKINFSHICLCLHI